jgi:hypothetical protein
VTRFCAPLTEWRQQGQIAIWRFEHHSSNKFPGWHFSADEDGCANLRDLLERFVPGGVPHRTWIVDPARTAHASKVVGYRRHRVVCPKRIRISRRFDDSFSYELREESDALDITIGNSHLSEFLGAVANIRLPQHEFQISWGSNLDEMLWFWWWLND